VIHELSEERKLALELTNKLNEELASVTSRFNEQLASAHTRISSLEAENLQLRRAQGLDTEVPPSSVKEPANDTSQIVSNEPKNKTGRPTRPISTGNTFRSSMRKTLRRTLDLKREEMRVASKQRLLDIESEVGLLLEELNMLHDIDGENEPSDESDESLHADNTNKSADNTNKSTETSTPDTDPSADLAGEERKLKKATSAINLKELQHRVQSSAHQTAVIVDKLHERAATVVQQAQAESGADSKQATSEIAANTEELHDHTDSNEYADMTSSDDNTPSDSATSPRSRIDSQAPGKDHVAARVKSARTKWQTHDNMLNTAQPSVHKAKVPLKRIDTAPNHSFVRGVPRANTKTPALALNSPRGVNQPVVTPSMLDDKWC